VSTDALNALYERLRSRLGEQVEYEAPEELGSAAVRYYAMAVGDTNPVYREADLAGRTHFGGIIAPPTLICETNQYMGGSLRDSGYLGHLWEPDHPGLKMLRAGNEYEFLQPVRPHHRVKATWTLRDVSRRQGRSGSLVFVTSLVEYRTDAGELLTRNVETLVYQTLSE
jgi:acyl dehydratase